MTEIGEMLGVTRQRVAQLVSQYDDFPAPEAEPAAGRVWSRTAVETWIHAHPVRPTGRAEERRGKPSGMFALFNDDARQVVVLAQEEARLLDHGSVGTHHLLLGTVRAEGLAAAVLMSLGVDIVDLRERVRAAVPAASSRPTGHIPFTPRAKHALELSVAEIARRSENMVGAEHVLLALLAEHGVRGRGSDVAVEMILESGLSIDDVRGAIDEAIRAGRHTPSARLEDRLARIEERLQAVEARLVESPASATRTELEVLEEIRAAVAKLDRATYD